MTCVFFLTLLGSFFFAKKLLYILQSNLTRFICTYFNDVLKFFGTEKVKISGTAYSET